VQLARGLVVAAAVAAASAGDAVAAIDAGKARPKPLPKLSAAFTQRSYFPGQVATLKLRTDAPRLVLQVLRAGAERNFNRIGKAWGPPMKVRWTKRSRSAPLPITIGAWDSGLYFLRITVTGGDVTYAPFIVRSPTPGLASRVAVVLATNTWAAYNHWDANADGTGDTWYASQRIRVVNLQRPFLNQGKPPYYRTYDRGFLRFLVQKGHRADHISDEDLDTYVSGEQLAQLYDLIVFHGHHEYQTWRSFDLIERYRDLGGNLAFLSANNFFWRVELKDNKIWRLKKFRDLGRPEARLVGVQYRANDRGGRAQPYVLTNRDAAPWLFAGLPFVNGEPLGTARYGIEFDMVTPDSPPGTTVLAEVNPALPDPSIRGQMAYYTTPAGAKVFAAGTLGFGGSSNPVGDVLFANLWSNLVRP
jgi:hypothetical protein